ncbi:uncharacterized protein LOC109367034 isoform X2 [Meleagris gallopavo]|uniref:uncharacterized protein LOC109367034 isoform X2 n=1 Tax=Meleagris gallopavo TaxID=9103 RepID=UPI00093FD971|nr:uncharacterized protein LOC109367034 isoform X2 [Meleagris gallopavo]
MVSLCPTYKSFSYSMNMMDLSNSLWTMEDDMHQFKGSVMNGVLLYWKHISGPCLKIQGEGTVLVNKDEEGAAPGADLCASIRWCLLMGKAEDSNSWVQLYKLHNTYGSMAFVLQEKLTSLDHSLNKCNLEKKTRMYLIHQKVYLSNHVLLLCRQFPKRHPHLPNRHTPKWWSCSNPSS